jgi:hypothetical protein
MQPTAEQAQRFLRLGGWMLTEAGTSVSQIAGVPLLSWRPPTLEAATSTFLEQHLQDNLVRLKEHGLGVFFFRTGLSINSNERRLIDIIKGEETNKQAAQAARARMLVLQQRPDGRIRQLAIQSPEQFTKLPAELQAYLSEQHQALQKQYQRCLPLFPEPEQAALAEAIQAMPLDAKPCCHKGCLGCPFNAQPSFNGLTHESVGYRLKQSYGLPFDPPVE